jgi:hypothetical protein
MPPSRRRCAICTWGRSRGVHTRHPRAQDCTGATTEVGPSRVGACGARVSRGRPAPLPTGPIAQLVSASVDTGLVHRTQKTLLIVPSLKQPGFAALLLCAHTYLQREVSSFAIRATGWSFPRSAARTSGISRPNQPEPARVVKDFVSCQGRGHWRETVALLTLLTTDTGVVT